MTHILITFLPNLLFLRKVSEYWSNLEITVLEGLNALTTLINTTLSIGDSKLTKAVQATGLCKKLLGKLDINITKEVKSVSTF